MASRPRNAATTRDAILASARKAFAQSGYDGAGVRDIAAGAGVTAMLVNRYFGSKEQLFAEAIAAANAMPSIATPEVLGSAAAGEAIARALVAITRPAETPLEGFEMLVKSAASPRAADLGRGVIEAGHQATVSAALTGPDAPQRAALILSLVAGLQMMRQSIGLTPLAEANPETWIYLLAPIFEALVKPTAAA